jgi:hypothetical protein
LWGNSFPKRRILAEKFDVDGSPGVHDADRKRRYHSKYFLDGGLFCPLGYLS